MNWKQIEFEDARKGDFLVSDGGSVRLEIASADDSVILADGISHYAATWAKHGFHVERQEPPKPIRVVRELVKKARVWWDDDVYVFDADYAKERLVSAGMPKGPLVMQIMDKATYDELEAALKGWHRCYTTTDEGAMEAVVSRQYLRAVLDKIYGGGEDGS